MALQRPSENNLFENFMERRKPDNAALLCALEPRHLVDAFQSFPPEGFESLTIGEETVAFSAPFSVLTTLDGEVRERIPSRGVLGHLRRWVERNFLTFRTLFVGATVTEYLTSARSISPERLVSLALQEFKTRHLELVILKDVALKSPLLSAAENERAARLLDAARAAGFEILEGQALAHVPMTFSSSETYFERFSNSRRKDLRRKLRARKDLEIDEVATGDRVFESAEYRAQLYTLYSAVYTQSEIHFDKLTPQFFDALLRDHTSGGIVVRYHRAGRLIGFNLCYHHGGNLVDKYVGFLYPDARESNLYFVSWFYNLELARRLDARFYIAGWTDPVVKRSLGAEFTFTRHAVYFRNPLLRLLLKPLRGFFEADAKELESRPRDI